MGKIRILYVPVSGASDIKTIDNTLEAFQQLEGGYIETDHVGQGVIAIVNEDGIALDLPLNKNIRNRTYYGPVLFCGVHDGKLADFDGIGLSHVAERYLATTELVTDK